MPNFYYLNPFGKKERIFPLHYATVRNFYICETQKAEQINVHESCIITEHSEEEVSEARKKYLETNYKDLLRLESRDSNQSAKSSSGEKTDK
jgi:hypothetical protein